MKLKKFVFPSPLRLYCTPMVLITEDMHVCLDRWGGEVNKLVELINGFVKIASYQ